MTENQYYEQEATASEFLEWYKTQDIKKYEKPSVTIDNVIFAFDKKENQLKLLLIKRAAHPFKDKYALPGGFINPNEDAKEAAKRETFEETNVKIESENQEPIKRIYSAVKKIDSEYILLMCDDYFLKRKVKNDEFFKFQRIFKTKFNITNI